MAIKSYIVRFQTVEGLMAELGELPLDAVYHDYNFGTENGTFELVFKES